MNKERLADSGALTGFAAWFLSHLAQINGFLQFCLLLASIVATVLAARYHWRNTKK